MTEEQKSVEEFTCGFGRCAKEHPLHCCHTAYGVSYASSRKNTILRGWKCDCGKTSRVVVAMRAT